MPNDPSVSQLKVYGDLPRLHVRLSQVRWGIPNVYVYAGFFSLSMSRLPSSCLPPFRGRSGLLSPFSSVWQSGYAWRHSYLASLFAEVPCFSTEVSQKSVTFLCALSHVGGVSACVNQIYGLLALLILGGLFSLLAPLRMQASYTIDPSALPAVALLMFGSVLDRSDGGTVVAPTSPFM